MRKIRVWRAQRCQLHLALNKSVQDTVIPSYNSMSFTNPSDEKTHATKGLDTTVLRKKNLTKTTHIPEEKHATHTPITVSCTLQQLTHKHTHTLGVFSLMAERSESEELTSPTNTVHPVCMWARQRAAVRTADVLLHITNMIYNQRIWVSIPTMRSAWIKNRFEAEWLHTAPVPPAVHPSSVIKT